MSVDTSALFREMVLFDAGNPHRIQHFTKVHAFARQIGAAENLPAETMNVLEVAALTHDIGIRVCEEKYRAHGGPLQEKEGPPVAEALLTRLGYARPLIERVCYLIGHHHTYDAIDAADYQILVEADFLVNLYEDGSDGRAIRRAYDTVFRTESGKAICRAMFGLT